MHSIIKLFRDFLEIKNGFQSEDGQDEEEQNGIGGEDGGYYRYLMNF